MTNYGIIENPLSEALTAILGKELPREFSSELEGFHSFSEKEDFFLDRLQDFCSLNANPYWATGESIMDSAEIIVERAIENANIG